MWIYDKVRREEASPVFHVRRAEASPVFHVRREEAQDILKHKKQLKIKTLHELQRGTAPRFLQFVYRSLGYLIFIVNAL